MNRWTTTTLPVGFLQRHSPVELQPAGLLFVKQVSNYQNKGDWQRDESYIQDPQLFYEM